MLLKRGNCVTLDRIVFASLFSGMMMSADAAVAGVSAPAPAVGVGMGALLLIGLGYRTLRNRIGG